MKLKYSALLSLMCLSSTAAFAINPSDGARDVEATSLGGSKKSNKEKASQIDFTQTYDYKYAKGKYANDEAKKGGTYSNLEKAIAAQNKKAGLPEQLSLSCLKDIDLDLPRYTKDVAADEAKVVEFLKTLQNSASAKNKAEFKKYLRSANLDTTLITPYMVYRTMITLINLDGQIETKENGRAKALGTFNPNALYEIHKQYAAAIAKKLKKTDKAEWRKIQHAIDIEHKKNIYKSKADAEQAVKDIEAALKTANKTTKKELNRLLKVAKIASKAFAEPKAKKTKTK